MKKSSKKNSKKKPPPARKKVAAATGSGLRWVPINDFFLIPPYLVEQIEGRDYEVERLYELAPKFVNTADCILGVFADDKHKIQGFMWAGVNPLTLKLVVHALSVAPEYQRRGIVAEAHQILRALVEQLKLKSFVFNTKTAHKFTSAGCRETGLVQMEG